MAELLSTRHPGVGDPDLEAARAPTVGRPASGIATAHALPGSPPTALGRMPAAALVHVQRFAGNAAVVQLLRAGGQPAAPPATRPAQVERDAEAEAVVEEAPPPQDLLPDAEVLEPGQRPTPEMKTEKRAEGEGPPVADEDIRVGGGGFPFASAEGDLGTGSAEAGPAERADDLGPIMGEGGFVDGGRAAAAPFGDATDEDADADHGDGRPRAFVSGGKTGTRAWGGGAGAGPKGNQESGSIQELVKPEYDSSWGGIATNADAWVMEGTGIVTVKRDYLSSSPGDQGNGWYVTDKAAAALEAHERKHVGKSRDVYIDRIQPMLDRIVQSYSYGKGKVYRSSEAKLLVKRYVAWDDAIKGFDEDDRSWNGKGAAVDQEDQFGPNFPKQYGAAKVNGKDFTDLLKMPGEPKPPE